MRILSFLPLVLVLAAACSAPSYQEAPMPSADSPMSGSDCRIYMARTSQVIGKVRALKVFENEKEIGSIDPDSYLCWDRPAGRSLVRFLYEGPILDEGEVEGLLDLTCEPGQVYYYAISLRQNDRKPTADLLSPEEGKQLIDERVPAEAR